MVTSRARKAGSARVRNDRLHDDWINRMHDLVAAENQITRQVRRPVIVARREIVRYLRSRVGRPADWNIEPVRAAILARLTQLVRPIAASMRRHFEQFPRQWILVQARTIVRHLRAVEIRVIGDRMTATRARRRHLSLIRESAPLCERGEDVVRYGVDVSGLIPGIVRDLFRILGDEEMDAYLQTDEARAYQGAFQRSFARSVRRITKDLELSDDAEAFDADDLADEVGRSLDRMADDLERIVRTQTQSIADDTGEIIGEYISPAVKWMQYTTMLDGRVCLRCAKYRGRVYRINDPAAPKLPLHDYCRCSYIPVVGSKRDAPDVQDYDSWLRSQPADRQLEILGRTRYELFAAGMKTEQFVNNRSRVILVRRLGRIAGGRQRRGRDG